MKNSNLYNLITEERPNTLYGTVQHFEPHNDEAINDDWAIPSLALGVAGLLGNFKSLGNLIRAKNIYDTWDKRKYWGIPFRQASKNPQKAIKTLKEYQTGFVPNADGKGVNFVWGEYQPPVAPNKKGAGYGLSHILGRRNEQGYDGNAFLDEIPALFETGRKYTKPTHNGRYYIGNGEKESVIRTDFNGKPWKWLDSAYYIEK